VILVKERIVIEIILLSNLVISPRKGFFYGSDLAFMVGLKLLTSKLTKHTPIFIIISRAMHAVAIGKLEGPFEKCLS